MKVRQWILTGAACLVCLGAGMGIGLLLGQNNQKTTEPVLLGQGNPLPADTDAPVLLGGIKGVGGSDVNISDVSGIQSQLDSLVQKMTVLADDFNALTSQFKQETAVRNEWIALHQSTMLVISSEKDKTVKVPAGFAAACEKLGVKLTVASGGRMSIGDWNKALSDISAGIGAAQAKLKQTVEKLKSKLAEYEQTAYEYHTTEQRAGPGVKIIHNDMAPMMKTMIEWAEEIIAAGE